MQKLSLLKVSVPGKNLHCFLKNTKKPLGKKTKLATSKRKRGRIYPRAVKAFRGFPDLILNLVFQHPLHGGFEILITFSKLLKL